MVAIDPRIHPFRPGIAAAHLKGMVDAATYVEGVRHAVIEPIADLRRAPSHDAALETQVLYGDAFTVYETTEEGWAWGQMESDGYVGWIATNALADSASAPTHKVVVPRTLCFSGPNIKLPPAASLSMGATLFIARQDGKFAVAANGWHLPASHVAPLKTRQTDFVRVAETLLGAPYLWGGKSVLGIDCSGLVQLALAATGVKAPRDSDMQELALGEPGSVAGLRRGDLVFWKGHVAIARDGDTLIHANAHHMMVAIEPAELAFARIAATGSVVTGVRRL